MVLFTMERAAFFLLIFGLTIYLFFSNFIKNKNKFFFIITLFILVFFLLKNNNHIHHRMINETKITFFSNNKIHLFSEGHTKHYLTAYEIYKNNKILGVGPNNFRKECQKDQYKIIDGCTTHPHNFYIQILAEVGILGFFFIITFFIVILINLLKNIRTKSDNYNEFRLCIIISILINFWPITTSGNFFGSSLSNIYIIPFALLMLKKPYKIK